MTSAILSILLAFASISAIWVLNLALDGQATHASASWLQAQLPSTWQRVVALALPFSLLNLGIGRSLVLDPAWGGAGIIVAGVVAPAVAAALVGGLKFNGEIYALIAAVAGLGLWLGFALQRAS